MSQFPIEDSAVTTPVLAITSDDRYLHIGDSQAALIRHLVQDLINASSKHSVRPLADYEWFDAAGNRLQLEVSDGEAVTLRLTPLGASVGEQELAERVQGVLEAGKARIEPAARALDLDEEELALLVRQIPRLDGRPVRDFLQDLSHRMNEPVHQETPPEHRAGWFHNTFAH
ncbi:hypothetical protein [Motilibacter deserti]|uniref:Uncharacterized protein n=1 Tax=Motilibacter deserti TaxID=2714956 RepID=A0ABX0GX89_9ACTN|nr:hypothetical protein [Motilibacter deserti]NHC15581.1 hypothetical protein [Motilibacter deserti]